MASVTHHQFTVQEYESMIAQGILTEDDRVELIRGEILKKMSIGVRHAATVNRIAQTLIMRLAGSAVVSIQNPVVLSGSEPEPDIMLLTMREDFYESAKPTASDVRLLIEVADTSLEYDREVKLPLYAASGIREVWIINLNESLIEVYRDPHADGNYATRTDHAHSQALSPLAFSGLSITPNDVISS